MTVESSAKVCVLCGRDCSNVPRVRDRQGRYACSSCAERRRRAANRVPPRLAARGPSGARESSGGPIAGATGSDMDSIFDLPDGGTSVPLAEDAEPIPIIEEPEAELAQACPVCLLRMAPGTNRCFQCGYDAREGVQTSEKVRKTRKRDGSTAALCVHCGYDLTGVPQMTCPECGGRVEVKSRRDWDKEESRRIAMWAYLKPVIMLTVGTVGIMAVRTIAGEAGSVPIYLLLLGVNIFFGVVAYIICCMLWMGFDAPIHRVALEFAGVYAIADLVYFGIAAFLPAIFFFIPQLVSAIVLIGLLMEMLELELEDAIYVTLITVLLRVAVVMTLMFYFMPS